MKTVADLADELWGQLRLAELGAAVSILEECKREKVPVRTRSRAGLPLIHFAAWNGRHAMDLAILMLMENGCDPNQLSKAAGWPATRHALVRGHNMALSALLTGKIMVRVAHTPKRKKGAPPPKKRMVRIALKKLPANIPLANPNWQDQTGNTDLHLAVQLQNVEACKLLLASGAKKDLANMSGCTPAHLAMRSTPKIMKLFGIKIKTG